VSPTDKVSQLINCLTKDEDQRQDLWVYYLSGNAETSFSSHLDKLNREFNIDSQLQELLWAAFKNPPSDKFKELLSNFSEVEQSVVCLLALGLTVSQLSKYKGISEVRIRHVITVIRYNECWHDYKEYIQSRSSEAIQAKE
jgi:hypothetical protein